MYGVRLHVKITLEFLNIKHFKHLTAIKFTLTLSQNLKMTLIQTIPPSMRFMKMIANSRMFVFSDTLQKVSGCIKKNKIK